MGWAQDVVLLLRVHAEPETVGHVAERLRALAGARHVLRAQDDGTALVTANVQADAADAALAAVRALGVPAEDVELLRLDSIAPHGGQGAVGGIVWADLLNQAGANSRPLARYLVLMAVAGVIAGFGVIYRNDILIVGAMAISPDTLPITAACTGLVLRRYTLAGRALVTLVLGLATAGVVAGGMTAILNLLSALPAGFDVSSAALHGLDTVNVSTPFVAAAAAIASILALETRASAAVGVAISVTTIPASAYLGVAAGVGELHEAWGALLVLTVNVVMLIVGGCLTLLVQRRLGSIKR
jgi:uncharacterized hydrophobic protein (TIGR00271 family)